MEFSKRLEIEQKYNDWVNEAKRANVRVDSRPLSVITWLEQEGLLKDDTGESMTTKHDCPFCADVCKCKPEHKMDAPNPMPELKAGMLVYVGKDIHLIHELTGEKMPINVDGDMFAYLCTDGAIVKSNEIERVVEVVWEKKITKLTIHQAEQEPFYAPKEWKDRIVENPGYYEISDPEKPWKFPKRRKLIRSEGRVEEPGDKWNADTMNEFERRIADAFKAVKQELSEIRGERVEIG